MNKTCTICKINKGVDFFYKRKSIKDGFRSECKECTDVKTKKYRTKNPQTVKDINDRQYKKYSEKIKKSAKNYRDCNRKKINLHVCTRLKNDPMFRAIWNVRNRTRVFLKNKNKYSKKLGCSFDKLVKHLESQFTTKMTWRNYGLWQIDHKHSLALAYKEGPESFARACNYTNLQPLWIKDHIKKTAIDMKKIFI